MTKEQLVDNLNFISNEEVVKHLQIYVTAGGNLQLFNIDQNDLDELLPLYIDLLKTRIVDNGELSVGAYSVSSSRENMIYQYDLGEETMTSEMKNAKKAGTEANPDYFTCNETSIEAVDGLYAEINDGDHRVVLYKQIIPLDKTYGRKSYLYGCKHDNTQFERKKYSMLRITPGIQMLCVDDAIILVEMQKLEKSLGLDAILQKEAAATIQAVADKNIMEDTVKIKEACEKPSILKKLRHALQESKTKDLDKDVIVRYAKNHRKLKFKFNAEGTLFNLDSRIAAERFIKLLDDDYLFSQLTNTEYDSEQKGELKEAVE